MTTILNQQDSLTVRTSGPGEVEVRQVVLQVRANTTTETARGGGVAQIHVEHEDG